MMNPVTFVARGLLAAVFVGGGINQLKAPAALGPMVDAAKDTYGVNVPVSGQDLVKLNGAGMFVAGTGMALGVLPRLSALSLAGMLIPTTVVGHAFWKVDDPGAKQHQMSAFMANAGVLGGLLMVAADRSRT